MVRAIAIVLAVLVYAACVAGDEPRQGTATQRDTLTRRQRDSMIGASNLPGAGGVRGALRAQDSAAARRTRADSIR